MLIINSPVELGTLNINVPTKFDVDIVNTSEEQAKVTDVHAGCNSCTVVRLDRSVIFANETVQAHAVFTPKTLGSHNKSFTITYNIKGVETKCICNFKANVV